MKILDILKRGRPSLSFEIFPPKTAQNFENVRQVAEEIASLKPDFMSVTYGAGGGTSEFTADLSAYVQDTYSVPSLAHLTCVSSSENKIQDVLSELKRKGIENVLALRGDIPDGFDIGQASYRHANELISVIRRSHDFCIGGACYPEKHPESGSYKEDLINLKKKIESGCEFLTTQMFFDNDIFYNFLYRVRDIGITVPVIAGIMPLTSTSQIRRILAISGSVLPPRFARIVERYGDDPLSMQKVGIIYATAQILDLYANGVDAVHVYTMNKPAVARQIMDNLSEIIR